MRKIFLLKNDFSLSSLKKKKKMAHAYVRKLHKISKLSRIFWSRLHNIVLWCLRLRQGT